MSAAEGESLYAKATATKFGILPEQLDDALALAADHGLAIDTVHAHVGDGFLTDGLPRFEVAIEPVASASRNDPRTSRSTSTPTRRRSPSISARSA
jgi:diaminopimelate decarboxylase